VLSSPIGKPSRVFAEWCAALNRLISRLCLCRRLRRDPTATSSIKQSIIERKRAPEKNVQELDRRKPNNITQSAALATLFTPVAPLATFFAPMLPLATFFPPMAPLATLFPPMAPLATLFPPMLDELNGQRRRGCLPDRGAVDDRSRRNIGSGK
jgi:hypothetical protein